MDLTRAIERRPASAHADRPTFTISEVARLLDVTPDAITKAERVGHIPSIPREVGGAPQRGTFDQAGICADAPRCASREVHKSTAP